MMSALLLPGSLGAAPPVATAVPIFVPERFFLGATESIGTVRVFLSHRRALTVYGVGRMAGGDTTDIDCDLGMDDRPHDVGDLVDQIATRLGGSSAFRPCPVESDVPKRSVVRIGPTGDPLDWPSQWPRPILLLRRPEPIDGVVALMPDQPPKRFVWRDAIHVVTRADGPKGITDEWRRRTSEAFSVRDYFRVENERGERYWVFRRGDGQLGRTGDLSWWMHGVFA